MRMILLVMALAFFPTCAVTQHNISTTSTSVDTHAAGAPILKDRESLNALLLTRISPPWDSQVELYINILAETGDYHTAKRLAALLEEGGSPMKLQLNAAVHEILKRRDEDALRFDPVQRKQLSDQLVAEIPGNWDIVMVDDVTLLGEIGDEATAKKLSSLLDNPDYPYVPGTIVKPIVGAIQKIEQRSSRGPNSSAHQ
jgi:hypothetical protein